MTAGAIGSISLPVGAISFVSPCSSRRLMYVLVLFSLIIISFFEGYLLEVILIAPSILRANLLLLFADFPTLRKEGKSHRD